MIDVTSLPESEYMFIFRVQVVLIVFLVLRLGRLTFYIIRKDEKSIQHILGSFFQFLFPFIMFISQMFYYKVVSNVLLFAVLLSVVVQLTFYKQ
ncbi:MAG TPA: hypothetical protein DD432_10050 [Eubacterium sp.]|nr:hypothetical protein [Eubacterium sp.]